MQSYENRKGKKCHLICKQQNVLSYYDEENWKSENPERRGARSVRELRLLTNRNGTCRMIQNINENQPIRSNHPIEEREGCATPNLSKRHSLTLFQTRLKSIRSNHQSGSAMHTTIISKIKNVS